MAKKRPAGVKGQLPLGGDGKQPATCPCRANDHRAWEEHAHPHLRGMLETRCKVCGRWIGNRPRDRK